MTFLSIKITYLLESMTLLMFSLVISYGPTPTASMVKPSLVADKVLVATNESPTEFIPQTIPDVTIPPVVDGIAPLIIKLPTTQNVVFLGIDDGGFKRADEIKLLTRQHIKASLFLSQLFIKDNPNFFKPLTEKGSLIENHTTSHELMSKLSYDKQKKEICDEADLQLAQFGRRPNLFRPPGGDYNLDTQRAAAACGMRAVVLWIAKANGGSMQYQIGDGLQPGDIVLMHFRPEFAADLAAFVAAQNAAGLHTELLENWLPPSAL